MTAARDVRYIALGDHAKFMASDAREELLEGPAGTGKTRCATTRDHELLKKFAGYRVIWIRKTLVSLRKTVLPNFEEEVAPGFPWVNPGASRETRMVYKYPNGSELTLCGMNDPLSLRSGEFDRATYFESHQATLNEWEEIAGRVRRFTPGAPCSLTADTNPAHKGHFLFKRSRHGYNSDGSRQMAVFRSRHWMNPKYWDVRTGDWTKAGRVYVVGTLANMSGARRARLYKGWWVSQSGQVWPTFDEAENVIGRNQVPGWHQDPAQEQPLDWYFASVDWGFKHAGVMQVWGVKLFPPPVLWRMYRVCLVYRTEKDTEWWAEAAMALDKRYNLKRYVCDPSRQDMIKTLNRALGRREGGRWLCENADNRMRADSGRGGDMGGLDAVRWGFRDGHGVRRVLFVDPSEAYLQDPDPETDDGSAMGGPDLNREEQKKPLSDVEEIPDYIMAEAKDDDLEEWIPDRPKDKQDDDGCLVAGTLIRTGRGEVPIEAVREGDHVETPWGGGAVTASGRTGVQVPTWEVRTAGGRVIRGTPDHLVWSGRGLVRLDSMRYGDIMAAWDEQGTPGLSTRDGRGARTPRATTGRATRETGPTPCCTAASGKPSAARFRSTRSSTTSTETPPTTASKTSSASLLAGTPASTASSWSPRCDAQPQRGTDRPRAGSGTEDMPRRLGSLPSQPPRSGDASGADAPTASARSTSDSAPTPARRPTVVSAEWMTRSAPARIAARASLRAGTARSAIADVVVASSPAAPADVYNLAVDPWHVYFAGGLLVRNCDATRYAVQFAREYATAFASGPRPSIFHPGSAGQELDHERTLLGLDDEDEEYNPQDYRPWGPE